MPDLGKNFMGSLRDLVEFHRAFAYRHLGRTEPGRDNRLRHESQGMAPLGLWEWLSRQYDFIFSFMPTFFFLVYFTLSHMTLLSHGSHVQSHDGSPDLSHDEGTWSVTWPWTIFTSHTSHYDSLLVFHLFLAYDSLYLISDSSGCFRLFIGHTDSYCHIILTVWYHWWRVLYYS